MLDKISKQLALEEIFNKNQQVKRIEGFVKEFLTVSVEENNFKKFLNSLLTHLIIQKRASIPTMVGLLRKHAATLQEVADMIQQAVDTKWVTWDPKSQLLITQFELNKYMVDEMNKYMFPLPLITKPAEVKSWNESGYLSPLSKHIKGVTGVDKFEGDACLDVLNIQNSVELSTEERVFNQAPVYLKNIHGEEDPFKKRLKLGQFKKFTSATSDVMNELFQHTDEIYLTHFYDKRGRLYCRAYHANYQGFDWQKAYMVFANKEVITNE